MPTTLSAPKAAPQAAPLPAPVPRPERRRPGRFWRALLRALSVAAA